MAAHRRSQDASRKRASFRLPSDNFFQSLLFIVAIFLFVAVMIAAAKLGINAINSERNAVFWERWQYRVDGGAFSEIELPNNVEVPAGSLITLKNQLPSQMVKGATLLLKTTQQDLSVAVGNIVIYSSGEKSAVPSSAYHFVRLPNDCASKPITVYLSSPYDNYSGFLSQVYIGSKASNLFFLLHENGLRFIIGFLILSAGLLMAIMFSFSSEHTSKIGITSLGAFFACAGYWVIVSSRLMQFILPHPMALTNSGFFALTLLPVFSGIYYYYIHNKSYKKIGKGVLWVVTAASILFAVVACARPTLPIRAVPYYLIFLAVFLLMFLSSLITESIKTGKLFTASILGMFIFAVCALLELVFYLVDVKAYAQSHFLLVGLLLFCILMVVDSAQGFARIYRSAVKVDALSVLAYLDSLTGLQNRTAFLEELSTLVADGENDVTIAMYDINNLKIVNDTMGHLVGDALLRHGAKAIIASLRQEDKSYRIGGDEFVAILRHSADFDPGVLEARLLAVLEKENRKTLSYTLSIAYGFATYSKDIDHTLFDTQARADTLMYARKKIQKSALHAPEKEVEISEQWNDAKLARASAVSDDPAADQHHSV